MPDTVPDTKILQQLAHDVGAETALMLMSLFKKDTEARIKHVRSFLEHDENANDIRLHAHSLQGLCHTYGAAAGSQAAMNLLAACDNDADPARIAVLAQTAVNIIPVDVEATIAAMTKIAAQATNE